MVADDTICDVKTITAAEATERIDKAMAEFADKFKDHRRANVDVCPHCHGDITEYVFNKEMRSELIKLLMKHYAITP